MTELIERTRYGNGLFVQGFRYLTVAGVATVVDWALFAVILQFFGLHYVVGTVISLAVGTYVNYRLSVRFVFAARPFDRSVELLLVYTVNLISLGLSIAGMIAFVEGAGFSPFVAKGALMVGLFGWNYLLRRYLVFAEGDEPRLLALMGRIRRLRLGRRLATVAGRSVTSAKACVRPEFEAEG